MQSNRIKQFHIPYATETIPKKPLKCRSQHQTQQKYICNTISISPHIRDRIHVSCVTYDIHKYSAKLLVGMSYD